MDEAAKEVLGYMIYEDTHPDNDDILMTMMKMMIHMISMIMSSDDKVL